MHAILLLALTTCAVGTASIPLWRDYRAVGAALSTVGGKATLCFNCADGTHDAYALVGAAVAHWERLRAAAGE